MTTKNQQLQKVFKHFENGKGHLPTSAREACEWGVQEGLLSLPEVDPYDILAGQMAAALREEYDIDAMGRKFRVNHAVRVTKSGVQTTFWATLGFAPRDHMQKAFTQRRNQIIGDCFQLKIDVDVYNDLNPSEEPIQLILNFEDDVTERQYWDDDREAA
jgi:hypothetical protein